MRNHSPGGVYRGMSSGDLFEQRLQLCTARPCLPWRANHCWRDGELRILIQGRNWIAARPHAHLRSMNTRFSGKDALALLGDIIEHGRQQRCLLVGDQICVDVEPAVFRVAA